MSVAGLGFFHYCVFIHRERTDNGTQVLMMICRIHMETEQNVYGAVYG